MSDGSLTVPSDGSPTDSAVGVQLQSLRVFQGLSRDEAARVLLISGDTLDQIESGSVRPSPSLLLKIADTYHVPPSRVFDVAKHPDGPDPADPC